MEQINFVHILGTVGSVRTQNIGGKNVARMTIATNLAYKGADGCAVIETTWHYVTAWEGEGIADLAKITRGAKLDITGRLRTQRYTGSDGTGRTNTEIVAKTLTLIDESESVPFAGTL